MQRRHLDRPMTGVYALLMSIAHKIHCACCGNRKKRVRLESDRPERIEIDCKKCHIPTAIITDSTAKAFDATIEVPLKQMWWPRSDENGEPVFICPFCTHLLTQRPSKDGESISLFNCQGNGCKRDFEIESVE